MLSKLDSLFNNKITIKDSDLPPFLTDLIYLQKYVIAYWSYPRLEEPISLMFSKPPGAGGSTVMDLFNNKKWSVPIMHWKQELSVIDIYSDLYSRYKSEGKRLLYIEDENRLLGKKSATVKPLYTALILISQKNGLTDIVSIGGQKVPLNPPLKMGIVSSITKDVLDLNFYDWYIIGRIDREIIVSWTLTNEQEEIIMDFMDEKMISKKEQKYNTKRLVYQCKKIGFTDIKILKPLRVKADEITVSYYNKFMQYQIILNTMHSTAQIKSKDKPTRLRKYQQLVGLTIGKVISEGRDIVEEKDVSEICRLTDEYFKLQYNPINGGEIK